MAIQSVVTQGLQSGSVQDVVGDDSRRVHAVKTRALSFLGRAYHDASKGTGAQVFNRPLVIGDVTHIKSTCIREEYVGSTLDQILESDEIKMALPVEVCNVILKAEHKSGSKNEEREDSIVCVSMVKQQDACFLNAGIPLRADMSSDESGIGFVSTIFLYTGYCVRIKLSVVKSTVSSESRTGGELQFPISSIAHVGIELGKMKDKLKGKEIKAIETSVHGFGGYSPERVSVSKVEDLESALGRLAQHFSESLRRNESREMYIPLKDGIRHYSRLDEVARPPLMRGSEAVAPPTSTQQGPEDFSGLYKRMLEVFNSDPTKWGALGKMLQSTLQGRTKQEQLSLTAMFSAIKKTFMGIPDSSDPIPSGVLVLGASGVGKSLFLNYLLGARLERDMKGNLVSAEKGPGWPEVGSEGSCTRGYSQYESYIDTGGLFDTMGREFDICNAVAIHMAIRRIWKGQVILMVSGTALERRATEFLEMMKKLKSILPDTASWSSVRILFNPPCQSYRGTPLSAQEILEKIEKKMNTLEDEVQRELATTTSVSSFLTSLPGKPFVWVRNQLRTREAAHEAKIQELSQRMAQIEDTALLEKITDKLEQVELLSYVANKTIKILSVDVADENEEKRAMVIGDVQGYDGRLAPLAFRMNSFVPNGFNQFKVILDATAAYFNYLADQCNQLRVNMGDLDKTIANLNAVIASTQALSDDAVKNAAINNAEKSRLTGLIAARQEDQVNDTQELDRLMKELALLKGKDNDPIPLDPITPEPSPISSRSWFGWGRLAQSYTYTIAHTCALIDVKHSEATSRVDWNNNSFSGYYENEDRSSLREGKYSIKYTPCWWGVEEKIEVTPFVAGKDDVGLQNQKRAIEHKIGPDPATVSIDDAMQQGLRVRIARRDHEIEHLKRDLNGKNMDPEQLAVKLEQSKTALATCVEQKKALQAQLNHVEGELEPYRGFCNLLVQIVKGSRWEKDATLSAFCKHFTTPRL
jgi:hypothetical protein